MLVFKIQEKKVIDESRVAVELRKHYEAVKNKYEKVNKEKEGVQQQNKQLASLLLVTRKALEVSVAKNKKYEEDFGGKYQKKEHAASDQHQQISNKSQQRIIEDLENEITSLR